MWKENEEDESRWLYEIKIKERLRLIKQKGKKTNSVWYYEGYLREILIQLGLSNDNERSKTGSTIRL